MSAIFFTKEICDLRVWLLGKAAIKETGVLPVIHFLGFRALRTSLALICESNDSDIVESNLLRPNL